MHMAVELTVGTHTSSATGRVVPINQPGIFIPYDENAHRAMLDLNRFLHLYGYFNSEENLPDAVLDRSLEDIVLGKHLLEWMKQDNSSLDDQALTKKFHERCRCLGRKLREQRLETEKEYWVRHNA